MQTARREHFREVKMAISETEMNLLGTPGGEITTAELIKARNGLVRALEQFDRTCHKHKYDVVPSRADI